MKLFLTSVVLMAVVLGTTHAMGILVLVVGTEVAMDQEPVGQVVLLELTFERAIRCGLKLSSFRHGFCGGEGGSRTPDVYQHG